MKKYLIDIARIKVNNAGYKLRNDFNYFAANHDYISLKVWFPRFKNIFINLFLIHFLSRYFFLKYLTILKKGSIILIQYPLNFNYIESFLWIRKIIPIRVGILINDLDSLRHKSHVNQEFKILRKLDYIISPNNKMSCYLNNNNINVPIININMYDYKVDEVDINNESEVKVSPKSKIIVVFAGNLKKNKSGFIYSLDKVAGQNILFYLYGDNYHEEDVISDKIIHLGTFSPDNIEGLKGDYGLVWDGPDTATCSGNYGSYLKLNNPHKTSLYLTAGLPIITWNQSAVAEFVSSNNAGVCVSDLNELPGVLNNVSKEEYQQMKNNALHISGKLKQGYYLSKAIKASEALFQKPKLTDKTPLEIS